MLRTRAMFERNDGRRRSNKEKRYDTLWPPNSWSMTSSSKCTWKFRWSGSSHGLIRSRQFKTLCELCPAKYRFGYLWMTQTNSRILGLCLTKESCIILSFFMNGKQLDIRKGMRPWTTLEAKYLFKTEQGVVYCARIAESLFHKCN